MAIDKLKLHKMAATIRGMTQDQREAMATKIGTITAEGRALSFFNCCFLAQQSGRHLAQVGGFRQWKKAGRCVKKGEHAIGAIYVPMSRKKKNGTEDEKDNRVRFLLVPVFDVDQTVALELAS